MMILTRKKQTADQEKGRSLAMMIIMITVRDKEGVTDLHIRSSRKKATEERLTEKN